MLYFVLGCMAGGFVGVTVMCLCAVSGRCSREEERWDSAESRLGSRMGLTCTGAFFQGGHMTFFLYYAALFCAKVFDNTLSTTKTILIQRNRSLLAGLTVAVSDFIYFMLIKNVLSADSLLAIAIVSAAGGIGCCLAVSIGNRLSKERLFVNVVMSDDKAAMQDFRDFLALHHITNVAADSYTRDWNTKTITVTAYAETKAQNRLIDEYIKASALKFKRVIQKN